MKLDNKNKMIWISLGAILLGLVVISKWLKNMPSNVNLDSLNLDLVLSKGSIGDEVAELQRVLVNKYGADLGYSGAEKNGVDGEFGTLTEKALLEAKGVKKISLNALNQS
jgi:hypothetical protein